MEARVREHGLPPSAAQFRMLKAMGFSDERLAKLAGVDASEVGDEAPGARRAPGLQAHRHLRRGVRLANGLHVLDLRGWLRRPAAMRGAAVGQREDHHSRRRPEPHRPGHRVRLLLLPCRLLAVRRGLRDHHGQLQSGDGVDRLRYFGPALFRAAHRRGRARDRAQGGDQRQGQGRHRAVRRPNAAEACPGARGGECSDPRHLARRHRPRRRPRPVQGADRAGWPAPAEERHRPLAGGGGRHRQHARLSARHPSVLRAWRQGDGDRARRCAARPLHLGGRGGVRQKPGAARHAICATPSRSMSTPSPTAPMSSSAG